MLGCVRVHKLSRRDVLLDPRREGTSPLNRAMDIIFTLFTL